MFTLYKVTFYLKFLSLTVKVERNKNKINNIKIIINLLTALKSYLKRYRKISPAAQLTTHVKSSTLYGRTSKVFRLDGLPLFCITMGLRSASSAIKDVKV